MAPLFLTPESWHTDSVMSATWVGPGTEDGPFRACRDNSRAPAASSSLFYELQCIDVCRQTTAWNSVPAFQPLVASPPGWEHAQMGAPRHWALQAGEPLTATAVCRPGRCRSQRRPLLQRPSKPLRPWAGSTHRPLKRQPHEWTTH